jgi:hypothetical protein
VVNRPSWIGGSGWNNNAINQRPGWVNNNITNINTNVSNRWNTAFTRPVQSGWWNRPADRLGYWSGWGDGVRHHWGHYHDCHHWFGSNWWAYHPHTLCGWHYYHNWGRYPSNYWWRVPAWGALTSWFTWTSTPTVVWQQPVYYDYGAGGNVTYQDNSVYIGGEMVGTSAEFAATAANLATVPPPATPEEAEKAEWMPLGTFIVTAGDQDLDPSRTIQLAVSREGVIAGTLYNVDTDAAASVQGQVDRNTQRVAMRVGEGDELVVETGLYNLTQNEAPLLVHYGPDRTETWLLVRLEAPPEEGAAATP